MARAREPIPERIERLTDRSGDCWLWTGSRDRDGYGVMTVGRKQVRAHRASYAVTFGDPSGDLVCHRCDVPACVNPDHLFRGSASANTADMIAKGRKAVMLDAAHPQTKITHAQRDLVRARRARGETLATIAADYGVNFRTISGICKGSNGYGTR